MAQELLNKLKADVAGGKTDIYDDVEDIVHKVYFERPACYGDILCDCYDLICDLRDTRLGGFFNSLLGHEWHELNDSFTYELFSRTLKKNRRVKKLEDEIKELKNKLIEKEVVEKLAATSNEPQLSTAIMSFM